MLSCWYSNHCTLKCSLLNDRMEIFWKKRLCRYLRYNRGTARTDWGRMHTTSVRLVGVQAQVQTSHLPSADADALPREPAFSVLQILVRVILTHTHTLSLSLSHTHTHSYTNILTRTHTLTHTHAYTLKHILIQSHTHTHTHSLTQTYTHSLKSTHTHTHTHTHALRAMIYTKYFKFFV